MDITLIPTKLNGTINARPSAVYSLLHATCQSLALHQVRTGASDAATANAARVIADARNKAEIPIRIVPDHMRRILLIPIAAPPMLISLLVREQGGIL